MEKPPCVFRSITHFSIADVQTYHPRLTEIARLTMEIGSKVLSARCPLVMIEPFPPYGRPGEDLSRLTSLAADDIKEIWVFCKPDDGEWARVEIRGRAPGTSIFVRCKRIESVPGWDGKQSKPHTTDVNQ